MTPGENTRSEMLNKLTNSMETEFNKHLETFQDIRSFIYPDSGDALVGELDRPEYKDLYKNVLDLTVIDCVDTLTAGMLSGMISPTKDWMKLEFKVPEEYVDLESRQWLDQVSDIMMDAFKEHEFYQSSTGQLRELGTYGTSAMLIEEIEDQISFQQIPMGEYFIGSDNKGKADSFARKVYMTAREIVHRYGLSDDLPDVIRYAYENMDHNTRFVVWHVILPREEAYQSLRRDYAGRMEHKLAKNMPWASYHYLEIGKENQAGEDSHFILHEGGYEEQPFTAPRWQREGRRTYGVGCGHKALSTCKRLRREVWEYILNLALNNNPPTKSPGTTPLPLDLSPGALNATQNSSSSEVTPLIQPKIDVGALLNDVADIRTQIQNAFHYKTFVLLRDIDKQMTIPELRQLQTEQMTMLAPYMTQISREMLNPAIDRVFGILLRAGAFPPPPAHMAGVDIDIGYIGELAKRQKAADLIPIEQTLTAAKEIAQFAPQVMDRFNWDKVLDRVSEANSFDSTLFNDDETVEGIRQSRAEKEQRSEQLEMLKQGAATAKDLNGVELKDNNVFGAADRMLGGSAQGGGQ